MLFLPPLPRLILCFIGLVFVSSHAAEATDQAIVLHEGLGIRSTSAARGGGRTAFRIDPIEQLIVTGKFQPPTSGASIASNDGTNRVWEAITAREDGSFNSPILRGGYVFIPYESDAEKVMLLDAQGHTLVYVNGEPRTGDPYSNGSVALPIRLQKGPNQFLFLVGRGGLRVRLIPPAKPLAIDLRDTTVPDIISGQKHDMPAAVIVVNSTTNTVRDLVLTASSRNGKLTSTPVPPLLPLSTRKVGFSLNHSGHSDTNRVDITLTLAKKNGRREEILDTSKLALRVRAADEKRKETFVSKIDGSVQYFAITPARPLERNHPPLALVLTVHGASVEAQGQSEAYSHKTWAHIVAPTNRRPYGFDWEDWGRRDAIEVLDLVQKKYDTDPQQTYLTGHSMGGHGTWQIGATLPDRFAALAPSAGWISFFSYAGGRRYEGSDPLQQLFYRSSNPSDTLALASNYLHHGIYILHGDADDNVPVTEARKMREVLEKFHRDFAWHEQPGAGHWWGNACVDWPPIFDMFARHKIPADESMTHIHFTTANPGASSSSHWVSIEAQKHDLAPSTIDITFDPNSATFKGSSENISRLALNLSTIAPKGAPTVDLDGQKLTNITINPGEQKVWLTHENDTWKQTPRPSLAMKGPHRYGPFKEAFNHNFLFVYGTKGNSEENTWAFAKARFDAEAFWYRGNGSIDVIADTDFDPAKEKDRGVILYGNADTHASWAELLGNSPIQARRGAIRIGQRELHGDNLAALFLRPRPGSDTACVAAITGSGLTGFKLTDRTPYFLAGVHLPDCTIFGPETLAKGSEALEATGYFGPDWSVEKGEFMFRN